MATSTPAGHDLLDEEEWESWNAVLILNRSVLHRLDTELRRSVGLAVIEFDVLITLYNAPFRRLTMSALAERVLLSPAGATHLVTRLERDGLVRRETDPADRRKSFAVLSKDGDARLRAARRTHNEVLRSSFVSSTTPSERRALSRMWRRLSREQPNPLSTSD
jgi:DNA-binding MarR family transcriptional regulator